MTKITVRTHPNLALIKYWGKRDEALMLPTRSSLSLTLDALTTETTITHASGRDEIHLAFNASTNAQQKVQSFIDLFRKMFGITHHFSVSSVNNFPTGAGLASSSSGFAALACGLAKYCKLNVSDRELSILARQGSGSAARSIHGGIVLWHKGQLPDGTDSYAEQLCNEHHWPEFCILAVIVDSKEKKINSRHAMQTTTTTNPLSYQHWIASSEHRLAEMVTAITAKDIMRVGQHAEQDWHGMHASMRDTTPTLDYWTLTSYEVIKAVEHLRSGNIQCFFTTDAGPNVFVCSHRDDVAPITARLTTIPGVATIIPSGIGGKPKIL